MSDFNYQRAISRTEVDLARRLAHEGVALAEIARRIGLAWSPTRAVIAGETYADVGTVPPCEKFRLAPPQYPPEIEAAVRSHLHGDGTASEWAKRLGMTHPQFASRVRRWRDAYDVPPRSAGRRKDESTRDMLADAMTGRYSVAELAERHNKSSQAVTSTLRRYGVSVRKARRLSSPDPQVQERRIALALRVTWGGETLQAVAEGQGVSRQAVQQAATACGVALRTATAEETREAARVWYHRERKPPAEDRAAAHQAMRREKTGSALRTLRRRAGLTQRQLAALLGVNRGYVSLWERGVWFVQPVAKEWMDAQVRNHPTKPASGLNGQ